MSVWECCFDTLESVRFVGNLLVCKYLRDAHTQIKMHRLDGRFVRAVNLPGIGTATGFEGRPQDTETFYTFSSFNIPARTYRYDLVAGEAKLFQEPKTRFNPDDYEVQQVFYAGKDGNVYKPTSNGGWSQYDNSKGSWSGASSGERSTSGSWAGTSSSGERSTSGGWSGSSTASSLDRDQSARYGGSQSFGGSRGGGGGGFHGR